VRIRVDGSVTTTTETFTAHGHHYAVCEITGLPEGSALPYEVFLGEDRVWPEPDSPYPPSVVRTTSAEAPTRLLYGSCRRPTGDTPEGVVRYGPDMLRATARRLAREEPDGNLLLLLIGDQVYADELEEPMRAFIAAARALDDTDDLPGDEVVHYDEYAELYRQAWIDPPVRWLMSTVPTLMIFDDHDIRDDWNTSAAWRRTMDEQPWWHRRVTSGLGAYWVYQHLGNLSSQSRAKDPLWARVRDARGDVAEAVDEFAWRAHAEPSSYRWSYRYDVGTVRVLMADTRCSRALGEEDLRGGSRSILGAEGHDWLDENLAGGPDHLVVASTVPVMLPTAVHHLEAWNEAVCAGAWGSWPRPHAERMRQGMDLEHWGAFEYSLRRLGDAIRAVASGERGPAPATVLFLSGDVHFSYAAPVRHREVAEGGTRVTQLVSSPLCNQLGSGTRRLVRLTASRPAHVVGKALTWLARVPSLALSWGLDGKTYAGNTIGGVTFEGRSAEALWYHAVEGGIDALPGVYRRIRV